MRRLAALTTICALMLAVFGAGPALAAHHHGQSATTATTAAHHHKAGKAGGKAHKSRAGTKAGSGKNAGSGKQGGSTSKTGTTSSPGGGATVAEANKLLNDCSAHGQLTHTYTHAELEKALSIMSAQTQQYSDCSDVIHQALLHGVRKSGSNSGGGGSSSTTTIVIIVVVVLVLLAAIVGGLALRRRNGGSGDGGGPAGPAA